MTIRKPSFMHSSRSSPGQSRVWLAVAIWLVISTVVLISTHAVIAAAWDRQGVKTEQAVSSPEMRLEIGGTPETALESAGASSALSASSAALSATPAPAADWFLFPASDVPATGSPDAPGDRFSSPPLEAAFLDVPSRVQDRNLSCEYQSAADLAAFYGWDLSWKDVFVASGPDAGGDPNRGFVGKSIDDPPGSLFPQGYGVYAEPVARGLRRLGIQAVAHREKDIAWLKSRVSAGHPVVVWATYEMMVRPTVQWQTSEGVTVKGVPYEHTFTVIGYDARSVWVANPWNAAHERYSWQAFDAAWALLDRMALTIDEAPFK